MYWSTTFQGDLNDWNALVNKNFSNPNNAFNWYKEQEWNGIVSQHKAEYYAGLHDKSIAIRNVLVAVAAPIAIAEVGVVGLIEAGRSTITFSAQNAGRKALIDVGGQLISNGGNIGEIDVFDVALSAYTSGIGSKVLGSTIDYRLNGTYGFFDKQLEDIAIDVTIGYISDGVHTKIDGVVPDKLLSPSGEVYKSILKSGTNGILGAAGDTVKN